MDAPRALKAALLITRVLSAHMDDADFVMGKDSKVTDDGQLVYEDVTLRLIDVFGGALMLLRGMILDVAELEDVHPVEIARLLEITTSMNEAIGEAEEGTDPSPYRWN